MFDPKQVRKDFPMIVNHQMQGKDLIYFDNGATTFKPQAVIDEVVRYYTQITSNAHRGDYDLSYQVDTAFENARSKIAKFINSDQREVVFTSGASSALNLVAYGFGRKFLEPGDIVLSTEAEHASCILPWMRTCEETGAQLDYIPLDEEGRLTMDGFLSVMNERVKVIAIAQITNVMGYLAPIQEICKVAHEMGAIVVVDGAQSVPHFAVDVKALDCDFLAFSAHKMLGPSGVGILYGKYEWLDVMDTNLLGGGSNARFDMCGNIQLKNPPYKFEAGTPAIEASMGFGAACEYLMKLGMQDIEAYEHQLHQYMIERLSKLDNIILYNPHADAAIVTFNVVDVFAQDAATYFNANGIAVRSGQHCAKLLIDKLQTSATIRASLYFYNTLEEIDKFVELCAKANPQSCLDVFF